MSDDLEYLKALEVQRRNFESQFGSVEELGYRDLSKQVSESDEETKEEFSERSDSEKSDESDSEFDDEYQYQEEPVKNNGVIPQVVRLNSGADTSLSPSSLSTHSVIANKRERKLLKSGRAPTLSEIEAQTANLKQRAAKTDSEEISNLENDLKLQRLLKESHILASAANEFSGADLTLQTLDYDDPTGRARKRILQSRISELTQLNRGKDKKLESMPMNMRKNMIAKRDLRVAQYERNAKDAGIVLPKTKNGEVRDLKAGKGVTLTSDRLGNGIRKSNKKIDKRERGLKINGIGRSTKNGLIISPSDIQRINNSGKKSFKKKR
ncbi:FAF1 [Candida oxycetoniae]|uniref:FAF1 n=1 Tax=Candida oxycetoniae TaxID=497107 RepID=A0AAI9T236_9ASCO|nr:FAF1 [Candida oxycetoniae]KAI3406675.2 FAF1 [Candida oxycetoniae]